MYSPAARLAGALRLVRTGGPCHLILLLVLSFSVLCVAAEILPLYADSVPVLAAAVCGDPCTAGSPQPLLCREPCRVTEKGLVEHALTDTIAR